ncbi:MAG: hypothetical protein Q4C64_07515 [Erysipelotrichia bacterium]|nr:hypothetical protein [Erysipelotrichia bacterium]
MLELKKGWAKAHNDTKVMHDYKLGLITLDTATKLIGKNNECKCTQKEFLELLRECGYTVNEIIE